MNAPTPLTTTLAAAGAVLAVLTLAAPSASAATRYAAPSGTGTGACQSEAPCSLREAVEWAVDGDEVLLEAGTYEVTGTPLRIWETVTVQPAPGAGRPTIHGQGVGVDLYGAGTTMRDLRVIGSDIPSAGTAVRVGFIGGGGLLDRMVIEATGATYSGLQLGGEVTLRNSAVTNASPSGVAVMGKNGGGRITGVTAIATPPGGDARTGLTLNSCYGPQTIEVANSIIVGGDNDIHMSAACPSDAHLDIRYSNYDASTVVGAATMTEGPGNQTDPPMLVDPAAGDFRQQPGSETVDAGSMADAEGPTDLLGGIRIAGESVDIGAHELFIDESVDGAELRGRHRQKQDPPRVKVKLKAWAAEPVTIAGRGTIKVRKRRYPLRKVTRSVGAGTRVNLVLKPRKKQDRPKIVRALKRGKRVVANLSAKFTDGAGNSARLKRGVRLR